ncbi:GreA/GreB family elongation factor [Frigidibacter sp. ROC022]|uniref:GreA/GreB family elongation factor n=1 Tax=Frigidibacter sp. ROC022 TaxID=2971796 RepID=UPI00215B2C59|nr:GreA/GreB family elongation factor [Frigidibacter sp. ROC022]MCR8726751.1 GreA/GreB family elongation factor [Frigidibacter sp. ROC022]
MSRAFVKEDAGPVLPEVAERPVSRNPNWVRPAYLAEMQARRVALIDEIAALRAGRDQANDLTPLAVAERDLRWLDARLASAIEVPPAGGEEAGLGATVTIEDAEGRQAVYTLVGEDEADPKRGMISPFSPLGRALSGARAGDLVQWARPGGAAELEVLRVAWDG